MRLLLLVSGIVAMIGLAVPVHADSGGDDANFIAALNSAGISYTSPDRAVAAGKAVCDQLDNGANTMDIVKQLTDVNPGFKANGAIKFAGIAATVYCPDQLADKAGGDKAGGGDA
jgi:hypothetical protein